MDRASTTFEAAGYNCFRVRGNAQLLNVPLSSLSLEGLTPQKDTRGSAAVTELVEQLSKRLPQRGVILVDAIGAVDELSFGIVSAAAERKGIPLIAGDLQPGGLTTYGDRSLIAGVPYVVELGPLDFRDIEELITAQLEGPVDEVTMSEIYAMSGGFDEMATALAKSAQAAGKLLKVNGAWRATGTLWSPMLVDLIAELLTGVEPADQDTLALLSISTISDRNVLQGLVSAESLERLNRLGLIESRTASGQATLVITPPILAEYFRHQLPPITRGRLAGTLRTQDLAPIVAPTTQTEKDSDDVDALAVRVLHEVIRARATVARESFNGDPTVDNALVYLRCLMTGRPEWEDVATVMRTVGVVTHDEAGARLLGLAAYAHAFVLRQRDDAIALLEHGRATFPADLAPLFSVGLAEIEIRHGSLDTAIALLPADTSWSNLQISGIVAEMAAYLHAGRGDFMRARAALETLKKHEHETSTRRRVAEVLTLIGEGHSAEAEALARKAFSDARIAADPVGLWRAAYAVGAVQLVQGRFDGTIALLNSIIAMGSPPPQCEPEAAAIFTAAEVVAARTGTTVSPLVRESAAALRERVRGLFPGMSKEWLDAYRTDDSNPESETLSETWKAARGIYDRGGRLSALLTMTAALNHNPDGALVGELHSLYQAGQSPFVDACIGHVDAIASGRPDVMLRAAKALQDVGRYGLAYDLYSRTISSSVKSNDNDTAAHARRLRADLELTTNAAFGGFRLRERLSALTERELEVAQMVGAGASNAIIGSRLGISTRTAETHVYRTMRKLGVTERRDIADLFSGVEA